MALERVLFIDICEGGSVFFGYLFTQNWQNVQIFKEASVIFRKTMQMYLKHKKVSVYSILVVASLVSLSCIVARKLDGVHYLSREYCLYYELQTWPSERT